MSLRKNKWVYLLALILSLPILNIGAFIAVATYLGGDALNGRIKDGHYFLFALTIVDAANDYGRRPRCPDVLVFALFAVITFIKPMSRWAFSLVEKEKKCIV